MNGMTMNERARKLLLALTILVSPVAAAHADDGNQDSADRFTRDFNKIVTEMAVCVGQFGGESVVGGGSCQEIFHNYIQLLYSCTHVICAPLLLISSYNTYASLKICHDLTSPDGVPLISTTEMQKGKEYVSAIENEVMRVRAKSNLDKLSPDEIWKRIRLNEKEVRNLLKIRATYCKDQYSLLSGTYDHIFGLSNQIKKDF
jgi:hypothetical protein